MLALTTAEIYSKTHLPVVPQLADFDQRPGLNLILLVMAVKPQTLQHQDRLQPA